MSTTQVALNQRIQAYSKYGNAIAYGAKDFERLGRVLMQIKASSDNDNLWNEAATFVVSLEKRLPPPLVDAELKMILFATAMLTSPNFPIPSRQLLIARYYANECHFVSTELNAAIQNRDIARALQAWDYGKDSWNSYFQVVDKSISAKVGDKFQPIPEII